jgi:hypothetical protein
LLVPHFALALASAGCLQENVIQTLEKEFGENAKTGTNATEYFSTSPESQERILAQAGKVIHASTVKLTAAGKTMVTSVPELKKAFKNKLNVYIWSCQSLIIEKNAALLRARLPESIEIVPVKVEGWSHWRAPRL